MPCRQCEPVGFSGVQYPPARLAGLSSSGEIAAFLRAAFSCDGGVNLYVARRGTAKWLIRNVYLACKHPTLIKQYSDLLNRLAIDNRIMMSDWRVLIQGQEPLIRYAELVGFFAHVTIGANSHYWQGTAKRHVLQLLLDSFGNPRQIYDLPIFH
jgi:hypothetical protein